MNVNAMRHIAAVIGILAVASCASHPPSSSQKPDEKADGSGSGADFDALCQTVECRGPTTVVLVKEDGTRFEWSKLRVYPVVQNDNWVTIFPGETLLLEADVSGDRLVNLRSVKENKNPERTLVFDFKQGFTGKTDMLLTVKNPFPRTVKYRLGMQLLDKDGLLKTSSCPVIAGGSAFEMWPHPIFQLVVLEFNLLPGNPTTATCEW